MAEELDDGEFWLPSQFLTDDDLLMDYGNANSFAKNAIGVGNGSRVYLQSDFSHAFGSFAPNSDLSSPVESVVGSTETESDEEDFMAGLTRRMARSTLQDDLWKAEAGLGYESQKSWPISGSPQSTLCNVAGRWSCEPASSRGSPNCLSQISSPPEAAIGRTDGAWDLLCAAAGEVAKMRRVEEGTEYYQSMGRLCPPRKPSPESFPVRKPSPASIPNVGFHSIHSLSYQQLQATQFQQLKQQQQMVKQQSLAVWGQSKATGAQCGQQFGNRMVQNRARNGSGRHLSPTLYALPTLQQSQQPQQQVGSGMRAVFLGTSGAKKECAGTGVFLPRRVGNPTETRKKPACSTVLLPDRVVQALNLKLNPMDAKSKLQFGYEGGVSVGYDAATKPRNNVVMAPQRRSVRPQAVVSQEVRLPQEWTY